MTDATSGVQRGGVERGGVERAGVEHDGDGTETAEYERSFLQERLRGLFFLLFSCGVVFHVVAQAYLIARGQSFEATLLHPGNLTGLFNGWGWWWLGRSPRRLLWLRLLDVAVTLGLTLTSVLVAVTATTEQALLFPHAALLPYGVIFVLLPRAAFIPCSTPVTAVVSTLAVLPVAILFVFIDEYFPHLSWGLPSPFFHLIWLGALVVLAVLISHTLRGLRRRVRSAEQLGQYRLVAKLGEGGMGVVYRAEHAMLRRATAIKLLKADDQDSSSQKRFEREVRLTATLTHPNTVEIYDYGRTPDGVFYYAMELLGGLDLKGLVEGHGPQPAARVVHILAQACGALAEAHAAGLIHRDIKPANLFLCDRGGVKDVLKVLDFGLVKHASTPDTELTGVNQIVGTPHFIAPEVIVDSERQDGRADLYALGVTAFYLLTGEHLFSGRTLAEVCAHHLHTPADSPSARLGSPVGEDLDEVILRCLAKEPEERWQSASDLKGALESCECAHAWSEDRAAEWWAENEAQPSAPPDPSESSHSLFIDFAGRT